MANKYCLMNYTVQCFDQRTQKTGCFLFDEDYYINNGLFYSIGKVYKDLESFYKNTPPNKRFSKYIEYSK